MTTEIDRKLAEFMGLVEYAAKFRPEYCLPDTRTKGITGKVVCYVDEWQPSNDDNPLALYQMSLVEAKIKEKGLAFEYSEALFLQIFPTHEYMGEPSRRYLFPFLTATASQRAQAAMKVIYEQDS